MKRSSAFHIAIEGCIGIGKTTLARKLARVRKGKLLLEAFRQHPFLSEFYADPVENAFETEMHFLLLHHHQLKIIRKTTESETITDFTFLKDKLFAELTLRTASELAIFNALYNFLLKRVPKPDLIVYLKGSDDFIIRRIRERDRSMEQEADEKYFKNLRARFDHFFLSYQPPVLVVEANAFDCIENPKLVSELSQRIDGLLSTRIVNKSANKK